MQRPEKIKSASQYIKNSSLWSHELGQLATLLNQSGLSETIKWGAPCYCLNGKNVVGLLSFKAYFGLWFHRGSEINDHGAVLVNAQKDKTKFLRQWRMTGQNDINAELITDYINQAIEIEKSRPIKIAKRQPVTFTIPGQLEILLSSRPDVKTAFEALTPGRQKEYALYIADAKRADTRARRIDKIIPIILKGVGLNDRYK